MLDYEFGMFSQYGLSDNSARPLNLHELFGFFGILSTPYFLAYKNVLRFLQEHLIFFAIIYKKACISFKNVPRWKGKGDVIRSGKKWSKMSNDFSGRFVIIWS